MSLIINIVAIINVFVIFALLFFRRENALPNRILAVAFLIPGLYFINTIFILAEMEKFVPFSLYFVQTIAVFFPIMLFYYFNLLIGKGFPKSRVLFTGTALLLIYIIGLAIRFSFLSSPDKISYIKRLSGDDYPLDLMLYTVFFYAWQLVYFTVITRKITSYRKQLDEHLSNLERSKYTYMVRFITILWTLNAFLVAFYIFLPISLVDYIFLPIVVNCLYLFVLYFGFHHNAVFTLITFNQLREVNEEVSNEAVAFNREKNGFIPTDKHEDVYATLVQLIQKEAIYCDPNLSIRAISNKIDAPEYIVSQAINHYGQKSFFDLINESRINDVKERLLKMSATETIEGVGYDVGFNSRSSFYRAFKKHVGKTPKQFIDSFKVLSE